MREEQKKDETILSLRKALLKRKYFSIFLALFTLGVNVFAWFVYMTKADVQVDATVANWDVQFKDDQGNTMQNFIIDISKMKPGMEDYQKTITIHNKSDVAAELVYEITSFSLLGHTIQNQQNLYNYLHTNYPFSVSLSSNNQTIESLDEVDFDIELTWPFESQNDIYYKQDDAYEYETSLPYYQLSSGNYVPIEVTSSTYSSLKSNLYYIKDDADTYFGMKCKQYETNTGRACLTLNLRLTVQQKNEND